MAKIVAKQLNDTDTSTPTVAHAALGRRKRAVARVRVYAGAGENIINGKAATEFCQTINQKKKLGNVLTTAGIVDKYHYSAKVVGGGVNGQVEAVVHGLARCVADMSESLHSTMAQNNLLRRDPREKERKKIYRVRARKMPQFAKR